VKCSSETSVDFQVLHGVISQEIVLSVQFTNVFHVLISVTEEKYDKIYQNKRLHKLN
jgi:hypothetical protein